MITVVKAQGYQPGTALFLSLNLPMAGMGSCHAEYTIRVYPDNLPVRKIEGINYNAGSPADDTHLVLSGSEATPQGALVRVHVLAWRNDGANTTFTGEIVLRQGANTLVRQTVGNTLKANEFVELNFDVFCVAD